MDFETCILVWVACISRVYTWAWNGFQKARLLNHNSTLDQTPWEIWDQGLPWNRAGALRKPVDGCGWAGSCVTLACSNEFQCLISIAYFSSRVASMVVKVVWYLLGRKWIRLIWRKRFSPRGPYGCRSPVRLVIHRMVWVPRSLSNGLWTAERVALEHVCLARRPHESHMYIHAKSDVTMLGSPQHARRQGRSNAIEKGTPKAAVLQ